MVEYKADGPFKILLEDLKSFQKVDETTWAYKINERSTMTNLNKIIIQGEITKTSGFSNEILIIDDKTGKAKITRGPQVPGDLSWISVGMHCSVIGTLLENGKLPSIAADKIAKVTNQILQEMWPWEVKELKGVMTHRIFPSLSKDNFI